MNCTASSYFIPLSMRAKATRTGALRGEGSREQERERKKRWREEQKIKSQSSHGYKVICKREKGRWLNLGKEPGKPTGVRRFTNALLGQ